MACGALFADRWCSVGTVQGTYFLRLTEDADTVEKRRQWKPLSPIFSDLVTLSYASEDHASGNTPSPATLHLGKSLPLLGSQLRLSLPQRLSNCF